MFKQKRQQNEKQKKQGRRKSDVEVWEAFNAVNAMLLNCECGCGGDVNHCRDINNVENYRKIKTYFFHQYHKYSLKISIMQSRKIPSFSLVQNSDVRSSTAVGLLQAIDSFDSSNGTKFTTFAYWRMTGEVIDELRRLSNFTNEIARRRRLLIPKIQALSHELGKFPTIDDINDNFTVEEFRKCLDPRVFRNVFNLRESQDEDEASIDLFYKVISDIRRSEGIDTSRVTANKLQLDEIIKDEDQRDTIFYYYYMGLPLKEIALVNSKSMSHMSRIKTQAEGAIREYFGSRISMRNALFGVLKKKKKVQIDAPRRMTSRKLNAFFKTRKN